MTGAASLGRVGGSNDGSVLSRGPLVVSAGASLVLLDGRDCLSGAGGVLI